MRFLAFKNPALKQYTGKTLAEVAKLRGTSPQDTVMDLVVEDGSRVGVAYFLMDEANVRRGIALPWMAFDSDAGRAGAGHAGVPEIELPPARLRQLRAPARHYARDEKVLPLPEAIRRLTSYPAQVLSLDGLGVLKPGNFATWWCSIRRPSRTTPPSTSPSSTPPACPTWR
jgi:N-acyl-D-amino-acid deacylase